MSCVIYSKRNTYEIIIYNDSINFYRVLIIIKNKLHMY